MTLKKISSDNIVRNNITLEPIVTYISASNLCEDIISHDITSSGIYGEVPLLNTKNKYHLTSIDGTRVYDVDTITSDSFVDTLNTARSNGNFEDEINEQGIFYSHKSEYNFGIEKIKQKYVLDDENYYKKKSVKNLYEFYSNNIESRQLDLSWGFSNYNCLNFFNTDEKLNENIANNKTHINCLSYPNILNSSGVPAFNFNQNDLTFSFYINQKRKNKNSFHFNPGCVLSVPKVINIHIVKGTKTDINGLTEKYRIFIELGDKTLLALDQNFTGIDLTQTSEFNNNGIVLSKDNIINYNSWHNISIVLSKNSQDVTNSVLVIFVDGIVVSEFIVDLSFINSSLNSENSFVLVGNKFSNLQGNIQNYVREMFSVNNLSLDDISGPYVNKHIDFGNHNVDYITSINNSFSSEIKDTLLANSGNYTSSEVSNALNAEIHDVRIYKENLSNVIKKNICDVNVYDFTDASLIFSLPVFYYEIPVKRKGLVNITNFENQDITLSNLYFEGPVNHYFSNKCHGHEVIIENFVYEFKQKICPNVIFGGELKEDQLKRSLAVLSENEDLSDITSLVCNRVSKGQGLLETYYEKLKSLTPNPDTDFENIRKYNFYYRNNFILPNDNGLQEQIYEITGYYNNYSGNIHKLYGADSLQFIGLNNIHSDKVSFKSNIDLISAIGSQELIDFTNVNGFLRPEEERDNFLLTRNNVIQYRKTFKESYDKYKNASLNVFHSGVDLNNVNQNNMISKCNTTQSGNRVFIAFGGNEFLKDLSNPIGRKINSDFSEAVGDFLPTIATKNVDNSEVDPDNIAYFAHELPHYNLTGDNSESYSTILSVSNSVFRNNIVRESLNISDSSLAGSGGNIKISLKDNGLGLLYRNDSLTKPAEWNYVGHVLYNEGMITILHPGLENFSQTNFKLSFKINTNLNVLELNLPAKAGEINVSRNKSYIDSLKVDESAFNADEDFVYITDISLHDENLNIVANAKLANPFPKKNTDNVLFKLKMDF